MNNTLLPHLDKPPETSRTEILHRQGVLAGVLRAEATAKFLDTGGEKLLAEAFVSAAADEGTLWLPNAREDSLVPVFNTGPDAARFVGQFRQPLSAGLISMVFATEQPFLENEVYADERQSRLLDSLLGVRTAAMIAVPLLLFGTCRGVISCVQLDRTPGVFQPERQFAARDMKLIQTAADKLARHFEEAVGRQHSPSGG